MRGATRPGGGRVRLMSAFSAGEGRTLAQREAGEKTNDIPWLRPTLEGLNLKGMVITLDALCGCPHNASYVGMIVMPMPPSCAVPAAATARTAAA